jgi:hypothetical protein
LFTISSTHNKGLIEIVTVHSTSKAAARKINDLVEMYKAEIVNKIV